MCKALKVKMASLNRIRHPIGSKWSSLSTSFEDSGDVRDCWYKTIRATVKVAQMMLKARNEKFQEMTQKLEMIGAKQISENDYVALIRKIYCPPAK